MKDKAFLFALSAVDALFTMAAGRAGRHPGPVAYALSIRIENAVVSYVLYIRKASGPSVWHQITLTQEILYRAGKYSRPLLSWSRSAHW